ncbi:AP-5 complex subunit mu-1 [Dissostichus eleginoides]|uniref:AP-5 complex subunit mu-1 n=1 Tax=Dissostichus eleginoides TaxID=100907 RepID=A0AAD9CCY4_DISEL|nr:AP-5 complex subunit mu-1 [Dissostichus eleginoides]
MRILRRRGADCTSTSSSALFRTVRLPEGWFHITADGAGGTISKSEPLYEKRFLRRIYGVALVSEEMAPVVTMVRRRRVYSCQPVKSPRS